MDLEERVNSDRGLVGIKNKSKMPEDDEVTNSELNLVSSTNMFQGEDIIIVEESTDPHSITRILNVCKEKILKPYLGFLSLLGLRPVFEETRETKFFKEIFNYGYTLQVIAFLVVGYILQYIACFRRDRGFGRIPNTRIVTRTQLTAIYDETCSGSIVSSFIIPSLLHFAGYMYAFKIFRKSDDDQLTVSIERVFLASSHLPNGQLNQRRIVKSLWFFIAGSFTWMLSSMALVTYMMLEGEITFKWVENSPYGVHLTLKILLIICIVWHDIVQASVISNYCLQAQLLKSYVQFLKEKLLQQPVRPLDWIRDIEEFKKLLIYLNEEIAPAVCFFTIINSVYAISGILWLTEAQHNITEQKITFTTAVNTINLVLWCFIAAAPFIQAARLTSACENVKAVGQEVRTRPFVHQDTSVYDLNSILIYTTSLKINAKLFMLPINGKYIGIGLAFVSIFLLVLGQTNYLHM